MDKTGIVRAICISERRGVEKHTVPSAHFIEGYGIEGDAHAGNWHRQVSLLSYDRVKESGGGRSGFSQSAGGNSVHSRQRGAQDDPDREGMSHSLRHLSEDGRMYHAPAGRFC